MIRLIIISTLCLPAYLIAAPIPTVLEGVPKGANVHFNVYLSNTQDGRTSAVSTAINQYVSTDPEPHLLKKLPALKEYLTQEIAALKDHTSLKQLLWMIPTALVASSYAYFCYQILTLQRYLKQKMLWSHWRSDVTLDQLLTFPQEQLAKELLAEIHRRYFNKDSITNLVTPLTTFMTIIEQEEEKISYYIATVQRLHSLRINRLFPINAGAYRHAQEQLQRIAYYKNIFITWAHNYNAQQRKKWIRSSLRLSRPSGLASFGGQAGNLQSRAESRGHHERQHIKPDPGLQAAVRLIFDKMRAMINTRFI